MGRITECHLTRMRNVRFRKLLTQTYVQVTEQDKDNLIAFFAKQQAKKTTTTKTTRTTTITVTMDAKIQTDQELIVALTTTEACTQCAPQTDE
jgi:hypothetical protein